MKISKLAALFFLLLLVTVGCQERLQAAAPCAALPGKAIQTLQSPHIAYLGASHQPYNSVPPTSGPHVSWIPAPGVYREEIPDELQVHALEHGHVLIQYGPGLSQNDVRILEGLARRYSRDVLVAPYFRGGPGVVLTAWGRMERLERVEQGVIQAFVEALARRYVHGWTGGPGSCAGTA